MSDVTGVSSAIHSRMQAAQHSVERGIMRYVASKSTEEKFGAIDRVASWGAAIDWTAEQFQDFVNEYPNLAEGIEFALNTAVVRSGAAAAASVAKNAPKYAKTIKEFAKSERGSVRVTKSGRSSSKSSVKKSGSDNDGTVKNTGKAASASAAKSVKTGSSSGQTGNSGGGSANASNSGTRGSTSSSGTTSSSSSSGGSRGYGSSLSSGIGGSYAVGKMEAVGTPTAVRGIGNRIENSPASNVTTPYKRPNNATTKAQRESVQNKPCVDCGQNAERMVADHKTPLVKEYYDTGTIDKVRMRDINSVQPQCPTCSAKQGARLSQYSKEQKRDLLNGSK